jgi:hypothetical protein
MVGEKDRTYIPFTRILSSGGTSSIKYGFQTTVNESFEPAG